MKMESGWLLIMIYDALGAVFPVFLFAYGLELCTCACLCNQSF